MSSLSPDVIREMIPPLRVHLEMSIGVAGSSHNGFQLVPSPVAQPACQEFPFVVVLRLAFLRVEFLAQVINPFGDWIIVRIGGFVFPRPEDSPWDLLSMQSLHQKHSRLEHIAKKRTFCQ